jgi:hypothetical protein
MESVGVTLAALSGAVNLFVVATYVKLTTPLLHIANRVRSFAARKFSTRVDSRESHRTRSLDAPA